MADQQSYTLAESFALAWQRGQLGGFSAALMDAIVRADISNLERLRLGFPVEVGAFLFYSRQDGWWEQLEARANNGGTE